MSDICPEIKSFEAMTHLPLYISIAFIGTTLLTIWLFFRAANYSKISLIILIIWTFFQSLVALSGFYLDAKTVPPRFLLIILPVLILIVFLFNSIKGKRFIDGLNIAKLTILHIVRIPVEIILFWLFLQKTIPQLMTFEGRNFDILAGITSPIIYYFAFVRQSLGTKTLVTWNVICLILLLNIVVNALLSAPLPIQQFAFDQPNIAILYFPFNLLPSVVVSLVLLAHLVAIRRVVLGNNEY